jgi:hypothetical protein
MKKFFIATTVVSIITTSTAYANPWKIQEGSILLDGTEAASIVAGYMFSGEEYEVTSSQIRLACSEGTLEMDVVGDSDLLTREQFAVDPVLDVMVKAGPNVETFKASVPSEYGLTRARIHDGPRLLDLLRTHDGSAEKAKVQLPVARTGVPEVRSLSLENVKVTSSVILATCGPLDMWTPDPPVEVVKDEELELDSMTSLSVSIAKKIVETLIVEQGVTIEAITEALKPLKE